MSIRIGHSSRTRSGLACRLLVAATALCAASLAHGQDRVEELEGLRDQIQDSRGRIGQHEAGARAILERLEEVDRHLQTFRRERTAARQDVANARRRLAEIEPELAEAKRELAQTRSALSKRANALYRSGELGPVRVVFSSGSIPELMSRTSVLRILVRHDAQLVERHRVERDRLGSLQAQTSEAVRRREAGRARVTRLVARLEDERSVKNEILGQLRKDRTSERRLLLELEQAAQALEETIRRLGSRGTANGEQMVESGIRGRQGLLQMPVEAEVVARFGRVIDPEFQTATFRSGVDFAAEVGAPVRSIAIGVVRFSGWFRGYGRIVIVDHGDAFHSISGHLDEIFVEVGHRVVEGQALGTVGETGSLRGPSLYFELRRGAEPVDPEPWFRGAGK